MNTLTAIQDCTIVFNTLEEITPIELFKDPEWNFGVFTLHIKKDIPLTKKHIHIFFTIDSSSSMWNTCNDGRTKMEHIQYTMKNMLRIFHEYKETNISIYVQSFDTIITAHIQDVLNIKDMCLQDLIKKINDIESSGTTNDRDSVTVCKRQYK